MNHRRTLNHLQHEKSPYLLQHADNPVDWHPWGEEAFARAKEEDKPLFLSIGYSTCHWCHVMAHESFEDERVAVLLNAAFVSIKVDREERPDVDGIYMRICQLMTGSGGWPLTIVMTPDQRPFFAATYLPKEDRYGRRGLVTLLPLLEDLWRTRRAEVETAAAEMTTALLEKGAGETGRLDPEQVTAQAREELKAAYDEGAGGFGAAPKFPMPHQLIFLIRHGWRTFAPEPIRLATQTLTALRRGGICDQLGFGFHRYSTDRQWLVPHFEKMLYDQALLTLATLEAFQATADPAFARSSREILSYVLSDLQATEGGFYAAEDADSEGEEGRFYLWRLPEVREILGPEEARFAAAVFGMTEAGNFIDPARGERTGANVLHLSAVPERNATGFGMDEGAFEQRLEAIRLRLLAARAKRVRPQRDDKILTDWNGLIIAALARAARVLGEPRYLAAARTALSCILTRLKTPEGRLLHRLCKGEAALAATLDDYAFLIWGLIECYEAGFAVSDLKTALALQEVLDRRFRDPAGGYFATADDGEPLLARLKESHDGAVPSGNAVTMMNLLRLGRLTGEARREEGAAALAHAFGGRLSRMPAAHCQWMAGLESLAAPSCEVVIAGRPGGEDTAGLLAALGRHYLPTLTLLLRPEGEEGPEIVALAPFTREMEAIDGRAAAYVCRGFSCLPPVTDPGALETLLAAETSRATASG